MITNQATAAEVMVLGLGLVSPWLRRHPLIGYFSIAFAGTWLVFAPILLSKRGLGLINLPDAAMTLLFIVSTYAGPFLSAFVMTGMTDGRAGVGQLLRRMVQWRIGVMWYLIVLLGYPIVFVGAAYLRLGTPVATALTGNWPAFVGGYLINIGVGFFLPTLGEEPGWRGFALPRMQQAYGPLMASLMLGILHALWHTPIYFVNGLISAGGFDPIVFVANSLAIVAVMFVWTWLFNNARGSILFATFVHATSNGISAQLPKALNLATPDPWFAFQVAAVVALLVVVLTRGRLGYMPDRISRPTNSHPVQI